MCAFVASPAVRTQQLATYVAQLERMTGRSFVIVPEPDLRRFGPYATAAFTMKEDPRMFVVLDPFSDHWDFHLTVGVWMADLPFDDGYIARGTDLATMLTDRDVLELLAGKITPIEFVERVDNRPPFLTFGKVMNFVGVAFAAALMGIGVLIARAFHRPSDDSDEQSSE